MTINAMTIRMYVTSDCRDVVYHLSCPSCGSDWWDSNAFPSYCPYCNTNKIPERTDKKEEE